MGQTTSINISERAYDADTSQRFEGYSAVRIYVGTDDDGNAIAYEAGDTTGRVLEMQNDFGTQQMAQDILEGIQGYQYQPLVANAALLDPAAELGDGVTVNGVYSGIFTRATTFGRLMASDISAPTDQEIAHEYSVDTASNNRAFSRYVASTRAAIALTSSEIQAEVVRATTAEDELSARITVNENGITTEVERATNAESSLSSRITQNESEISATVTQVGDKLDKTRTSSTFGWNLNPTSFSINANNSQSIFYADTNGIKIRGNAEVTGKVTATSGYIGGSSGFTITATAIYNGKSTFSGVSGSGVYIGTNGIALGERKRGESHSRFEVDSSGNLYAQSGTFAGSVYAKNIQSGGTTYGYFDGSGIKDDSIYGSSKIKSYSVTGGSYGNLASYTVAYKNTAFTSTLNQVGTNASNISSLASRVATISAGYFNSISTSSIAFGDYYLYVGSDGIVRGSYIG